MQNQTYFSAFDVSKHVVSEGEYNRLIKTGDWKEIGEGIIYKSKETTK